MGTALPVTIAGSSLKASRKGIVKVRVSCPRESRLCEGTVALRRGKSTLGTKKFVIRGGRSAVVRVKLTKKARKAIKKAAKRVSVSVFSRDLDGDASQAARKLRLRG